MKYRTAKDIVDAIGKPRINAAMGLRSKRSIEMHVQSGRLPAAWFDFCEKATGCKLPRGLFSFKGSDK